MRADLPCSSLAADSYARENNTALMLWWSGGRWWLGKLAELGQNRGWIKVESEAMKAHMIRECTPHSI